MFSQRILREIFFEVKVKKWIELIINRIKLSKIHLNALKLIFIKKLTVFKITTG